MQFRLQELVSKWSDKKRKRDTCSLSREQKRWLVELCTEKGHSFDEIAVDYGIRKKTLRQWEFRNEIGFLKGHGRGRPNCLDEVSDGKIYSTVVTAMAEEDNCQKPPEFKKLVLEQMERTAERRGTLANSAISKS